MTNDNFKPFSNLPKTETKIVLNDWSQGVKKSSLSAAARSRVVNRSGSNYLSPWADTNIGELVGYGPCYVCSKSTEWKDLYLPCPGVRDGVPCGNPNKSY